MGDASLQHVAENIITDSIWDYDSTITVQRKSDGENTTEKIETHTSMLSHLQQGSRFKIGDLEFIKLETFKNGTTKILCFTDLVCVYGENKLYPDSFVRKYLHEELLPIIEENVGATYIKEHCTDYTPLKKDGMNYVNAFSELYLSEKIGLLSYCDYMKYKDLIPKEFRRGWISNRLNGPHNMAFIMDEYRCHITKCHVLAHIRPVITIDSSLIVKTRVLSTYSV